MKLLAMIVQPMNGFETADIEKVRQQAIKELAEEDYDVINTHFEQGLFDDRTNPSVAYLSKSLDQMSKVDLVYFCSGWDTARGCKLEHRIAREYGIRTRYQGVDPVNHR